MNKGHYIIGKVICKEFDAPAELSNWGIIPDMKYLTENYYGWLLLHRISLHGIPNINYCIEKGKESEKFTYIDEYHDLIEFLIMTHSYLDTFNGIIIPSYPKSVEVKYIPKRFFKYIFNPLDDPDGLEDKFTEIARKYNSIHNLKQKIKKEYYDLPQRKGEITDSILELY